MGDVLPPLHSPYAALKAMQFPPQQKPRKLRELSVKPFKEISPARDRSGLPFAGFWVAGRIALPLLIPISALKDEHRTSNIEHPTSNEKTTTQSSSKYSVNPLSALERLLFSGFQSSLIADRRGSAIRPATRNPAKGKPLLSRAGDISLNSLTEAPVVFPAFAVGETASPQAQRKANAEGGRTSPMSKASENKGLNGGSEKKCPLPVNGCWISNAFFCIPGIAY